MNSFFGGSSQHAVSLLNIDENDLNFDLDDIDDSFKKPLPNQNIPIIPQNKTNATKKRKSPSPEPVPTSPPPSKNSFIEITKISEKQKEKSSPNEIEIIASNSKKRDSIDKFEIHNQSLFDLFDVENENDKDFKKVDIYSSTQLTQKFVNNNNVLKNNNLNQSSILEQQFFSPEKADNSKLIDKIYAQNLNHDQIWVFAKDNIIEQLNKFKINPNLLERYSIKNCINKVYRYCLLKNEMRTKNEIFRIPFAYGRITKIDKVSPSAVVYLQDDSDGVMCTISTSCTKKYSDYITVGTVMSFENACIIRLSSSKSSYHIIIDLNNLISIYYLNTNGGEDNNKNKTSTIDVLKIKNLNLSELNKNIKEFEKNLNNVDPSSIANTSISSNTSIINNISNNKNNNSLFNSNNQNYTKPNIEQNQNNLTSNKNPTNFNRPPAAANNYNNYKPINNQTIQSKNTNTSLNYKPQTSLNNSNTNVQSKRTFQFHKTGDNATNQIIQNNSSAAGTSNLNANQKKLDEPKNNIALSQEMFSQLIFGIEDELLKDD